jgi:SAM-dependent methyltransferase
MEQSIDVGARCNICGSAEGFAHSAAHHPRESYVCASCGSISRDRMLIFALGLCLGFSGPLAAWEPCPSTTLLETSGYRGHPRFLRSAFRYLNLIYEGVAEECLLADVASLPLRDESIDIVVSSDVFEHVRDDAAGFSEIARVLKPEGYFILQVPAVGELEETRVLVEARGDEDVFVAPPEYHAEHTLVYRYYGNDIVDRLRALGLSVLLFRGRVPASCITEQSVVVGQKAPYLSLGPRERRDRAWS